jgi:N-acetylmuramoyl-L-alanine amidase
MPYHPARPMVVIDPGDGSRDRETIGPHEEKMFALAAALELRPDLIATHRFRVMMGRDGDLLVPLEQRVAFARPNFRAREHHATLFGSLHADESSGAANRGLIYRFAYRASDRRSGQENGADPLPLSLQHGLPPVVLNVLASLTRRAIPMRSSAQQRAHGFAGHIVLLLHPTRHACFLVPQARNIRAC